MMEWDITYLVINDAFAYPKIYHFSLSFPSSCISLKTHYFTLPFTIDINKIS